MPDVDSNGVWRTSQRLLFMVNKLVQVHCIFLFHLIWEPHNYYLFKKKYPNNQQRDWGICVLPHNPGYLSLASM